MDGHEFDILVKGLSSGTNRRRVLRGLLGSAAAAVVVGSQTFEATARGKACPSGNGSECPANQVCKNSTRTCTKCDQKHFVTCKGSTGPGTCCFAENADCCICTFTRSGATFGTCGAIGQCATLYPPDVAVCA